MNNHERLMALTELMPMKQICINDEQYLQRYYAGTLRCGRDIWLHRFLRNDAERHLHSHPFNFTTIMLNGGYTEQYLDDNGKQWRITTPCIVGNQVEVFCRAIFFAKNYSSGMSSAKESVLFQLDEHREITVFDWHRIAAVEPDTWTCMIVDPERLPMWFFRDDDGALQGVKSSERDWWKNYNVRPLGVTVGDNSK